MEKAPTAEVEVLRPLRHSLDEFTRVVEARPAPGDHVTLGMSNVAFIDSTGVAMLLRVQDCLDAMECRLTLVDPSAPVIRVLTLLGLTEQFMFADM